MAKIGYCYVVCDIMHEGHIEYFKLSKARCDVLICGVLSDKATMEKKSWPVLRYKQRASIVAAVRYVDKVVVQREYSPLKNVKRIKPDVLFESHTHLTFPANNYMRKRNKTVVYTGYFEGQSSTKIKGRAKEWKKRS